VGLQVSVLGRTASGPIKTRNGLARLGISTLRLSTQGQLMHYFQFNIKDYQSHTGHLDDLEDLAYRRLLDWCYLHERPLPEDPAEVARLIRMRSHSDCIAAVLREFFVRTDSGWISERVHRELTRISAKSKKASESAKARWNKGLDANASESHTEGNATHNPLPITQDPIPSTQDTKPKVRNTRTSTVVECFDGVEPQVWEDWLAIRKAKKLPLTKTAMAQVEAEVLKAGISMQEALKECCLRGWGGFKASWLTREGGVTLNKQEALERRNKEVGLRWLQNQGAMNESE
jgi:uncharacterized protein YdaU (DUF1376 family)